MNKGEFVLACTLLTLTGSVPGRAQTGANPVFSCIENIQPNLIRKEGAAELVSDIYLVCSGGTPYSAGSAIYQTSIVVVPNAPTANRVFK